MFSADIFPRDTDPEFQDPIHNLYHPAATPYAPEEMESQRPQLPKKKKLDRIPLPL